MDKIVGSSVSPSASSNFHNIYLISNYFWLDVCLPFSTQMDNVLTQILIELSEYEQE